MRRRRAISGQVPKLPNQIKSPRGRVRTQARLVWSRHALRLSGRRIPTDDDAEQLEMHTRSPTKAQCVGCM
jgi:hypothetical protein